MRQNHKGKSSIKAQVASKLDDINQDPDETLEVEITEEVVVNRSQVEAIDDKRLKIENNTYLIVTDYREAVDIEKLGERYNTILNKYDYIVGDWGYDQLRLKGFFGEDNRRAPFEKKINFLEDYLYEYCNFGCAYFILEKEKTEKPKKSKAKRQQKRNIQQPQTKQQNEEKKEFVIKEQSKPQQGNKNIKKPTNKKTDQPNTTFKIRKSDQ